jgi:hypothetical protein
MEIEGTALSRAIEYNVRSLVTAIIAATAAATSAAFGLPVWGMFLGWVCALAGGQTLKEVFFSYVCFAAGIGIGAVGTLIVGRLEPAIGPLSSGVAVLCMATVIVSMRKAPRFNLVPNFILGVLGIFALHAERIGAGALQLAEPALIGAIGVWLAYRLQARLSARSMKH